MKTTRIVVLAAILTVAAAAVTWAAVSATEHPAPSAALAPGESYDTHTATRARDLLHALGRPRDESDALPNDVAQSPILADGIVAANSSRAVRGGDHPSWITESADGKSVCLLARGDVTCPPVEVLETQGAAPFISKRSHEPFRVGAVVADGVDSVTMIMPNGESTTVQARSNIAEFHPETAPAELHWVGPNGPVKYVVPHLAGFGN